MTGRSNLTHLASAAAELRNMVSVMTACSGWRLVFYCLGFATKVGDGVCMVVSCWFQAMQQV